MMKGKYFPSNANTCSVESFYVSLDTFSLDSLNDRAFIDLFFPMDNKWKSPVYSRKMVNVRIGKNLNFERIIHLNEDRKKIDGFIDHAYVLESMKKMKENLIKAIEKIEG